MNPSSNRDFQERMKLRTKNFAVRIINLVDSLPDKKICWDMGRQLLRSGTSVGANYRAACRARSNAEFKSKLGVVEEEADETLYWMELLIESGVVKAAQLQALMVEADEILRIVVSAIKNTPVSANNRKTFILNPPGLRKSNLELRHPNSELPPCPITPPILNITS